MVIRIFVFALSIGLFIVSVKGAIFAHEAIVGGINLYFDEPSTSTFMAAYFASSFPPIGSAFATYYAVTELGWSLWFALAVCYFYIVALSIIFLGFAIAIGISHLRGTQHH